MGVVNASTLIGTQKTFRALFHESFDGATAFWEKRAMVIPSTNLAEIHQWLGRVAAMKEWLDEKQSEQLRGFDFTVKNKDWENTIEVDRNHIEDDQLGLYRPRIQDLGMRAKQHPDSLLSLRRRAGDTTLGYDGQFFYDTDHAEGKSGSQSNKLTGTGTTAAQVRTDHFSAKAAFRKFKDDQGEPFITEMGGLQLVATIPPDLEAVFDELNNPAPGSTVPRTIIPFEVDPRLTDVNDYYYDFVGAPIKPFMYQQRKPITFVALDDPNASETVFKRKKFYYGVEGRYEISFAMYQFSIKITNT